MRTKNSRRRKEQPHSDHIVPMREAVKSAFKHIEDAYGNRDNTWRIASGFLHFDRLSRGFNGEELYLIAAPPDSGRKSFVLNIAQQIALSNEKNSAAIVSADLDELQIAKRMLAANAKINIETLENGNIDENEWNNLAEAFDSLVAAPIYMKQMSVRNMEELRACIIQLVRKHGVKIVFVIIQKPDGIFEDSTMDVEQSRFEISDYDIVCYLKHFAIELGIAIMAAFQLPLFNPPQGRDAKQSLVPSQQFAFIQQHADVIMLLSRDSNIDIECDKPDLHKAELKFIYNSSGPTDTIKFEYNCKHMRFRETQ